MLSAVKQPVVLMKAYLFAKIDTQTGRVIEVIILSDERPSIVGDKVSWGHLSTTYGKDYNDARKKMLNQIESIRYWGWVKPFMRHDY